MRKRCYASGNLPAGNRQKVPFFEGFDYARLLHIQDEDNPTRCLLKYRILEKQTISPALTRYRIHAPFVARKAQAGNFVIIRVNDGGERIPLTICESDPSSGTVVLIVQAIGKTTKLMATLHEGDSLVDVVGPLGKPTEIVSNQSVACIGGGVGTAELLPIAKALHKAGNRLSTIIGARTKELIILREEMAALSHELIITTDDGSAGRTGLVTEALRDVLSGSSGISTVYAIGPLPMMKAVAELTRGFGIKTLVSLNAVMVDGTGMCGGCRVTIGGTMKFACVDGPEFDAHQVDFDEIMLRNRTYREMELLSDSLFERGRACAAREATS